MSKVPHFVYSARPTARTRLKGLFESGPLKNALESPQALRANGWTMETQQPARIVKGEYLEIVLGDVKTIQLFDDGMLLAKVKADEDFLAWGSRSGEGFEMRPRLNPLALVEFTYSFVDVFRHVIEYADPPPVVCALQVNIQNAIRQSGPIYLNPYGLETVAHALDQKRYPAPEDSGKVELELGAASIRDNQARAAYQLVEKIYLWFGVPTEQIPYTTGVGEAKVLDVGTLRRGGKQS